MFPPPIIDGHLQRRQRHTDQIPGEERASSMYQVQNTRKVPENPGIWVSG